MKRIVLFLVALLYIASDVMNANGQNFVRVNRANQEQTITLSTGQVLEIQLPRKAATGYIWCESSSVTKADERTIARIGDGDFIPDAISGTSANNRRFGQSGTQIIRYTGAAAGTTLLTLELKRPWEKNGKIIDSYTITVISEGKYTGTYMPPVKSIHICDKPLTSKATKIQGIPSAWDWRPQCTPIKDQQQCGDCWAFASVATLECNISIIDNVTDNISDEFITNCFTDNNCDGCAGGNCAHEAWLASYTGANPSGGGAVYSYEDPWTTTEGTDANQVAYPDACGAPYTPNETIDSYSDIGGEDIITGVPSVDSIQYHIYYHGPVWVGIDASSIGWNNYSGGIWVETSPTGSTDHAISLVGWNDTTVTDGSGGYWILRNQWNTGWGVNGYMYISYASDLVGQSADYIVYKGGTNSGINTFTLNNDISTYPNPASNNIIIEIKNSRFVNSDLRVYDIVGYLILEKKLAGSKTSVDISTFSKGLYILKVENENGTAVKKLMKL
jgi:predicted secreted protein